MKQGTIAWKPRTYMNHTAVIEEENFAPQGRRNIAYWGERERTAVLPLTTGKYLHVECFQSKFVGSVKY